jgi:hypothetical protein
MTPEQEKLWREEYVALSIKLAGVSGYIPGGLESDPVTYKVYLAGRLAAQKELEATKRTLEGYKTRIRLTGQDNPQT